MATSQPTLSECVIYTSDKGIGETHFQVRQLPLRQLPISWVCFLLVLAMHSVVIAFMVRTPTGKAQQLIMAPSVQGILVPAPPAETVQIPITQKLPAPLTPPVPALQPKLEKAKPVSKPKPKPQIEAPPSAKAIRQEDTAPEAPASPPPQLPATPTKDEAPGAPITPPREDANHLDNPKPGYPSLSRRLREQGTVVLEVLILSDGSVGEIRIKESSGFKRLDDTAIKAVRQWRYSPARRGEEPIAFWYLQPLEFSLN